MPILLSLYKIGVLLRSAFGIALCYELIDVGFPCVNPTYGRGDLLRSAFGIVLIIVYEILRLSNQHLEQFHPL